MYCLANMQLETQKKCEQLQVSSTWRACALWTFMTSSFMYCQICMLEIVVCWQTGFFFLLQRRKVCKLRDFDLCFMRFLAGQFVFDSLCFISSCSPASAAVSWNAPYYCVQFLHVKNVLLDFRLTNAMFVFNLTCASVKQCVEIFQKMLVHNPPLWFLTVRWCAITHASFHYFDTGKKKRCTQSRYCVLCLSISQFV